MITRDGYAIFDIQIGKCLSLCCENNKIAIELGRHVWVGYQVEILGDSKIRNSSIVGANALVKGKFPNNCIIAG